MSYQQSFLGCYPAQRAAALSGVPASTVYDWARKGIVIPSVSKEREKLWSYADLVTLRVVAWLRSPKEAGQVRRTKLAEVRAAFELLAEQGINLWDESRDPPIALFVDRRGKIIIDAGKGAASLNGQGVMSDVLDLLAPFGEGESAGPDLRRPRPLLRIIPGKCSGEPRVQETRITSPTLAALFERGYDLDGVAALYPDEPRAAPEQAYDLERQLGLAA
jgi:uncharacterized protein (DUF433 family)/DNA-binding transcriptional MerR regulator